MSKDKNKDNSNLSQDAYTLINSFSKLSSELLFFFAWAVLILFTITFYLYSHGDHSLLFFIILLTALLSIPIYIQFYFRSRKISKGLKIWNKIYFDQNYTIIFNTTIPKGKNEVENVLDLSKYIFPELKQYIYLDYSPSFIDKLTYFLFTTLTDPKRIDKKRITKAMNCNVNGYLFDFAFKTNHGYFIIKNFYDKVVTVDDILQLIQKAKDSFKNKIGHVDISRILIVAKDYEKVFLDRETLENLMMEEIKTNLKIDLIIKENLGYLVLWISP